MLRIDINLLFTVINVLILCAAVRIFLWKPIHRIIAQRQEMVEKDFRDAAQAKAEAEAIVAEQKSLRDNIEEAKADAFREATSQAQEESKRIIANAKMRAETIVQNAETDARNRRETAIRETQNEISEIIVEAAAKISGISSETDSELYDAFLKKAGTSR